MRFALAKILSAPIRLYQYAISPLLGNHCRFDPTCSQYALEALEKLPLRQAVPRILWRVLRCHPFSKGGSDPVRDRSERD